MGGWHPPELKIENAGEYPLDRRDPNYTYLPEREWDQAQVQLALKTIKQNVRLVPKIELYKLHRLLFSDGVMRDLLRFPLLYCFFFGLLQLITTRNRLSMALYLPILFTVISMLIFYTNVRLSIALDLALIIIAVNGLSKQIELFRHARQDGRQIQLA